MNKKITSSIVVLSSMIVPIASVVSCGSDKKLDPSKKDSAVMMVGQSGHEDKGFLQGAYDGIQKAIKENMGLTKYRLIKLKSPGVPESKNGTNSALLAGAYNIVGVGYQYNFFNDQKYAGKYSNRRFIAIDVSIDGIVKENVLAVSFNAEQSSFLAGVAACLYLAKNAQTYVSNGGLKIGAFGGLAYGSVTEMLSGFLQGIAYYNDHLSRPGNYKVKFIGWGTSSDAGFTGGFVPGPNSVTASKTLLAANADVIFPVAGGQVSSVVDSIKSVLDSNTKIVGVDSDQNKVYGEDGGDKFITSSMKDTGIATFEALKKVYGKSSSLEFGQNNVGLENGMVKIAEGVIDGDEFGGQHFSSILKIGQNKIDITGAESIYKQLMNPENAVFKAAKETKKNVWQSKTKVVWIKNADTILSEADFS